MYTGQQPDTTALIMSEHCFNQVKKMEMQIMIRLDINWWVNIIKKQCNHTKTSHLTSKFVWHIPIDPSSTYLFRKEITVVSRNGMVWFFSRTASRAERLIWWLWCLCVRLAGWLVGCMVCGHFKNFKKLLDFKNSKTKMCFRPFWLPPDPEWDDTTRFGLIQIQTKIFFHLFISLFISLSHFTHLKNDTKYKQESPPAWTQEAYRPPCSEYSFCCPTRVPPPPGGVWEPPLTWVPPRGVVPDPGTPPGGTWLGYPPQGGTWPGYPPGGPGTPRGGTWLGYPPGGYLTRVPPGGYLTWVPPWGSRYPPGGVPDPGTPPEGVLGTPPGGSGYPPTASWHSGKCCKALWDMGTPPCGQTDWWMDRRVSKHYLPSYYVRGR